jgi:uncharacterized membrane protein
VSPASSDAAVVAAALVYRAGSVLCHQQHGRSFELDGSQLPVCARCTGLYAGAGAGAALAWLGLLARRQRAAAPQLSIDRWRILAVVSAMPTLTAWAAEHGLGLGVTNLVRFATALPLGAAVAAIVVAWAGGARFNDNPAETAIH